MDDKKQKEFEKNIVLLVGKGLVPMYIVWVPWFVKMVLHCDRKLALPSRKKVTKSILPNLAKYSLEIAADSTRTAPTVSISFDLWMSSGAQDILFIISDSISKYFGHKARISLLSLGYFISTRNNLVDIPEPPGYCATTAKMLLSTSEVSTTST